MSGPGVHSPVGASSIKRVLACPASVFRAEGIEDEESDHAALGSAVHALIEDCFRLNGDAWARVGMKVVEGVVVPAHADVEGFLITKAMANAGQVMVDAVRKAHPDRNQGNFFIERRFHCPTIHTLFYGTSDVIYIEVLSDGNVILHVWDYKNGAGVVVEVINNDQLKYYACGALEDLGLWSRAVKVVLHVVQPNASHPDGPVREWETTPEELVTWMEDVLVPGIDLATSGTSGSASGEHCRFCPARTHACPQLMADMEEFFLMVEAVQKTGTDALTDAQLSRFLELKELAKIVGKAAESTAFKRIQGGGKVDGWKLAKAKAFRAWKDGAEEKALALFGTQAYSTPEFKSPAQIDELALGSGFTAEHAFKPEKGLTLVKASDTRPEQSTDTRALFSPVTKPLAAPPAGPLIPPPPGGGRRNRPAQVAA